MWTRDPTFAVGAQEDLSDWLRTGAVGAGQQAFGAAVLRAHAFVPIPSVVSTHSWNVVFDPAAAKGLYGPAAQERLALAPGLHPPPV